MADQRRKSNKNNDSGFNEAAVVEAIFKGIFTVLAEIWRMLRGGKSSGPDRSALKRQIQEGWEHVELHLTQESTAALAVSEADKLLDAAFQAVGVRGTTMGERLKNAKDKFSNDLYQEIWEAHKLRNRLAHEIGSHASKSEAQLAVGSLRKALYQLGIL